MTASVAMLLLLVLMLWVPIALAAPHQQMSVLVHDAGTASAQSTPAVDPTETALNKEKLTQEVAQQQHTWENWLWTNTSALVIVLGGLIGLWRWLGDRRSERKKRAEERLKERFEELSSIVTGLGNEEESARLGAAVLLRIFLDQEGSEQFYTQVFDLAVANLRLPRTPNSPEDPDAPLPLTTLSQELIAIFKEAFPLAREWIKNRQTLESPLLQWIKARLKRTLQGEEPFNPQLLDASHIRLDNAFLVQSDLERIWMREASLKGAHLNRANLTRAYLRRVDFRRAWLSGAHLSGANLGWADLSGADLTQADLTQAHLRGANLSGAHLQGVNLSGADLSGVDLSENDCLSRINLKGAKYNKKTIYERTHEIKPTQWPKEFDPKIAGLTCIDY